MMTAKDGTSLIGAGLDFWFSGDRPPGDSRSMDLHEFQIEEWRLKRLLGADHFRTPPDYRMRRSSDDTPNVELTIPYFRFPLWHICSVCKRLDRRETYERGKLICRRCLNEKNWRNTLTQVPFVAICDQGHIQDFPWSEWVHKTISPACGEPMRLVATGEASLAGQSVRCDCGAERHLGPITRALPDGSTILSKSLSRTEGNLFLCQGHMPWHGPDASEACGSHIRGSLRNASNVYYAHLENAIYLPRSTSNAPQELIDILVSPSFASLLSVIGNNATSAFLRSQYGDILQAFSDAELNAGLKLVRGEEEPELPEETILEDSRTQFRRSEQRVLRRPRDDSKLKIRESEFSKYDQSITSFLQKVLQIDKLSETRVLTGFSRINPTESKKPGELLWSNQDKKNSWLPAYVVFGEGIYLELNEQRLHEWQRRSEVRARVKPLIDRWATLQAEKGWGERLVSPRSVLLHTFSHLLINRLTFECGYSSASLRERLYVSEHEKFPMAGLLIYTAAGDAEGTLGGLVRMGKPGRLEPVIERALQGAAWCSADPVCMEMGERGGQGPDSCNLAACHSCSLVPETACEEFNRFLDRGLVIGMPNHRDLGFFNL